MTISTVWPERLHVHARKRMVLGMWNCWWSCVGRNCYSVGHTKVRDHSKDVLSIGPSPEGNLSHLVMPLTLAVFCIQHGPVIQIWDAMGCFKNIAGGGCAARCRELCGYCSGTGLVSGCDEGAGRSEQVQQPAFSWWFQSNAITCYSLCLQKKGDGSQIPSHIPMYLPGVEHVSHFIIIFHG